ncbi:zinc finger protein 227-like [Hetaerina americana]|uniref:zinc finger protein 227-like n=1 Tax=Hetaerina americana TaxID=62018 RepID=UPI003A7F47BD
MVRRPGFDEFYDSEVLSHDNNSEKREGNIMHGASISVWASSGPAVSVEHSLRTATVEAAESYTEAPRRNWMADNKYEKVDIQLPGQIKKEIDEDGTASDAVDSSAVDVQNDMILVKEEVDTDSGCAVAPEKELELPMVTSMRKGDSHWSSDDEAGNLDPTEDGQLGLSFNEEVDIKEESDVDIPEVGYPGTDLLQEQRNIYEAHTMDMHPVKAEEIRCDVDAEAFECTSDVEADAVTYKCAICLRAFSVKGKLKRHMLVHTDERPFKCEICSKGFNHRQHLEGHMLTHTGERPHKCPVCQKGFTLKQHLKDHTRIHAGEKSHKCEVCSKGFTMKQQLTEHMLTHTGEKRHKCDVCSKAFSQKANLKRHMLIHTDERPHKCEICSKGFHHKQHLECHMLTHTGEKPYKCEVCPKMFTLKQNLKGHMLIHSGEKPHKCEVCSKTFRRKQHLKEHMSNHRHRPQI